MRIRARRGHRPRPPTVVANIARGQTPPGMMNDTEAEYANHLDLLKRARGPGDRVLWWRYEAVTLLLSERPNAIRYTPDFLVLRGDERLECHEVKGYWREDALLKIRLAASLFPFRFLSVRAVRGGGWTFRQFSPGDADATTPAE